MRSSADTKLQVPGQVRCTKAVEAFLRAGYTRQQVIEVVLGVALKTLSNYTNHIAKTPLNEQFAGEKWSRELEAA